MKPIMFKDANSILSFLCIVITSQFFLLPALSAQSPAIEWQRSYGGPAGDYAFDVAPTKDGGYIIAGETEANGGDVAGYHGNNLISDMLIIKTDKTGNIEWRRVLGGFLVERLLGTGIKQTSDGGYILAGSASSKDCDYNNNELPDFIVIKLDKDGNMLWNKNYGGTKSEYNYAFVETPDGGFVLAGAAESDDGDVGGNYGGFFDAWVIKIDASGNLLWHHRFGGSGEDGFNSASVTTDGNYILAGYTFSTDIDATSNNGERDFFVVELSPAGNVIWKKTYGGTRADIGQSVKATPDGGSIVVGLTSSEDKDVSGNNGVGDFWAVKLDKNGNIQWQKCYGGSLNEWAYSVELAEDGGYLIGGAAESPDGEVGCNYGISDCWLIKTDSKGNLLWHKNIGGSYYDEIHGLKLLKDGSIIFTGYTCSPEINGYHAVTVPNASCADFLLVKLAAPGTYQKPSVTIEGNPFICNGEINLHAQARFAGAKYTFTWLRNGIAVGTHDAVFKGTGLKEGDKITCRLNTIDECDDVAAGTVAAEVIIKNNPTLIDAAIQISADNTTICNCTPVTFSTAVINASNKPAYEWFVNDISTGYNGNTFITKTLQPGDMIKCMYTSNSACIKNGNASVSNIIQMQGGAAVTPTVNITASANNICKGSMVTFKAFAVNAGSKPSFHWMVNNTTKGSNIDSFVTSDLKNGDIITCNIATDPEFSCTSTTTAASNDITMQVSDKLKPEVDIITSSMVVCTGSTVSFHARYANAGPNPSFQWFVNGTNVGANDSIFTTSSLKDGDKIGCTLTVDPLFMCAGTAAVSAKEISISVKNDAAAVVSISASAIDVCYGTPITFTADVKHAGTSFLYQWMLNNAPAGINSPTYTTSKLFNGNNIQCVITPGNDACSTGPVNSNIIIAQINPLPAITISPSDTFVSAGSKVAFNTNVSGTIQSFAWQPAGKLQDAQTLSPITITLTDDQVFLLTITDEKGCTATKNAIVKINYPFYMPQAFTPNGDGLNDIFRIPPHTTFITLTSFDIYNRLGQKVFTTKNAGTGWDGTRNGVPLPMDTFVYVIKGISSNGSFIIKGTLVLIR